MRFWTSADQDHHPEQTLDLDRRRAVNLRVCWCGPRIHAPLKLVREFTRLGASRALGPRTAVNLRVCWRCGTPGDKLRGIWPSRDRNAQKEPSGGLLGPFGGQALLGWIWASCGPAAPQSLKIMRLLARQRPRLLKISPMDTS